MRLALSASQWQLGTDYSGNSEFRVRFAFYGLNFPAKESERINHVISCLHNYPLMKFCDSDVAGRNEMRYVVVLRVNHS